MKKNRILLVIAIVLVSAIPLSACNNKNAAADGAWYLPWTWGDVKATYESNASTKLESGESASVNAEVQKQICIALDGGIFAGHPAELGALDSATSTYLVSKDKIKASATQGALVFEGEQQREGNHDVLIVYFPDGTYNEAVGDNGLRVRDEGSFWNVIATMSGTCPSGYMTADQQVTKLVVEKYDNWYSQGITDTPTVTGWYTGGLKVYTNKSGVPVDSAQTEILSNAASARCDLSGPLEEDPIGEPEGDAAIGSSNCRTIVIDNGTAVWFMGARDKYPYINGQTRVFLVPTVWSQDQMTKWVKDNFNLDLVKAAK